MVEFGTGKMCLKEYLVARLERLSLEESLKDSGLEDLDDLQLAAPFDLEALQLGQRPVKIEDGVALLELLALLLGGRQDHG